MGDSITKNEGCDRTEPMNGESNSQSHLSGDMTHKSFNQIFRQTKFENSSYLPPADLVMAQFSDSPSQTPSGQGSEVTAGPVCEAPSKEKHGNTEVVTDEYGERFEVKDNRGHTYSKTSDGKWVEHADSDTNHKNDRVVKNLKVDSEGDISYDDNKNAKVHYEQNSDGSRSVTNEFGRTSYDKDGNCTEAPAGAGHSRKFHYTNGQLDQIEGKLGHWDRVIINGQASWLNRNNFAVWDGDFKVQPNGELEFAGRNGADWRFTAEGKDIGKMRTQSQ